MPDKQERVREIERALEAGAGVFTGALQNELATLKAEATVSEKMSAEQFYRSDKRWWNEDDSETWAFAEAYATEQNRLLAEQVAGLQRDKAELNAAWRKELEDYRPCDAELDNWSFQHFDFLDESEKHALLIMCATAKRADKLREQVERLEKALESLLDDSLSMEQVEAIVRAALAKEQG